MALVITPLVFWAAVAVHKRWVATKAVESSPAPPSGVPVGANAQVNGGMTPVDPAPDPVEHEWGAVDYSTSTGREVVAPRNPASTATRPRATRGDVARWLRGRIGKDGTNQLIRDAEEELGASESTVKRALRDVRGGAGTSGREAK